MAFADDINILKRFLQFSKVLLSGLVLLKVEPSKFGAIRLKFKVNGIFQSFDPTFNWRLYYTR